MELVYTVNGAVKQRKDVLRDEWPLCSLSTKNALAFTSTVDLSTGSTAKKSSDDDIHFLYVFDLDKPWEVFPITSTNERILKVEWHASSTRLLIATHTGTFQVWSMKDFLLNQWTLTHSTTIHGEDIVAMNWLHQGLRVNFNGDKKDSVLYTDKIARAKFAPSLSNFGGKAMDGWVALTSTGLIYVGLTGQGKEVTLVKESLSPWRSHIVVGDMTYDSSGDLIAVASDGSLTSALQCYRISLKSDQKTCTISCKPTVSLYAKCHTETALQNSSTARITHVKYLDNDSGKVLIIGAGDQSVSHVEVWNLTEQPLILHRTYQSTNLAMEAAPRTLKWKYMSSVTHASLPISIAIPRFPVMHAEPDSPSAMFQYIAVAYRDGLVKLINKNTFQPMTTTNLDTGIHEADFNPKRRKVDYGSGLEIEEVEKRKRVIPQMVYMQQTFSGCGLVGIDQFNCVYVMKAVNTRDPVTQISPIYLVAMLEYAIMMGYDWWDVLPALKPGMIEMVVQKLTDNFSKQPQSTSQLFYCRFMSVKADLYKCGTNGQQRAADCHSRIILNSITTLFKSELRPRGGSAQDKSPAEKLNQNCSKNFETDVDKVIVTLNPEKKEFFVDPTTLQALQQLIQWVGDFTLFMLTSLPLYQSYDAYPGRSLIHDAALLGSLRELLVLIKFWGLINPSCLPHFTTTSSNFDCLSQLFKLVTKIWLSIKDGNTNEFEESLIDECCLLPSQVLIPAIDEGLFGDMNYEASIFLQSHPIKYNFNYTPSHARKFPVTLPDGQYVSRQRKDIVRQVNLGTDPAIPTKQCCRCNCLSMLKPNTKVPALKAWDLRWSRHCLCGSQWKATEIS